VSTSSERAEQLVERETLTWHPAGAAAPFLLPLDELFRPL